ncbi:MAG: hypothetical protein JW929_10785 [Anaerolineales bacterium]|nr:hypothetical protein [Anaerolineales bacterium]
MMNESRRPPNGSAGIPCARGCSRFRILLDWTAGFLLAMVIASLGHELWLVFVVRTLHGDQYVVPLAHIAYCMIAGLIWLVFFLVSLEHLKRSAGRGTFWGSVLRILGELLLVLALGEACLMAYGFHPADRVSFLLTALEGAAGAGMLALSGRFAGRFPADAAADQGHLPRGRFPADRCERTP